MMFGQGLIFKWMGISSYGAGLVLTMGWNVDRCFVKQAQLQYYQLSQHLHSIASTY